MKLPISNLSLPYYFQTGVFVISVRVSVRDEDVVPVWLIILTWFLF